MFKFFKKTRQNLLNEGKTVRYFKYAVGEIILVVIGILIALQINNWNEQRKFNNLKTQYIHRLLEDLKQDTSEINKLLDSSKIQQESIKIFVKEIDSEFNSETLITAVGDYFKFGWITYEFTASTDTYTDLTQSGSLNIFKNSELSKNINEYYLSVEAYLSGKNINREWILPIDTAVTIETNALEFDPMTNELFQGNDLTVSLKILIENKSLLKRNAAAHFWISKALQNQLIKINKLAIYLISVLEKELSRNQQQ